MTLYWRYRYLFSVEEVKLILICVQTLICTHYLTNIRNKPKTELKVHKNSQGEDKIAYNNHAKEYQNIHVILNKPLKETKNP